jgi:hypothetical protein
LINRPLEALVLFRRSLEAAQDEYIVRNPERWVRVWLPALALCLAIEELIAAGPKRKLLQYALERVAEGLASGRLVIIRLW